MTELAVTVPTGPFDTVLIANRGEIAVRIATACREAGICSIAVYTPADQNALHTTTADAAYPVSDYRDQAALLAVANASGANALHPGYGFLAENAAFAQAVIAAGLIWIGPSPYAIATMGDKIAAKRLLSGSSVPLLPGYDGIGEESTLSTAADAIGFPMLIKAAAGGGGRGMRVVHDTAGFTPALAAARREAQAAFGSDRVFLEKYLPAPRHIEVQVLADSHGNTVHLGERECSIQRRHQKIVEEAPSPVVNAALRARLGAAAVAAAQAVEYVGAGTVEFLLDASGEPYFLEMNTRLQVEHPVTEAVTGLDLVRLQLAIAAGLPLPFGQADVQLCGHAIECRIYAEDAASDFLPASGQLHLFAPPTGPGVRNDCGVRTGDTVGITYDPQLAKLIVHASDRTTALDRLAVALADYAVLGVTTNLPFLGWLVAHPHFRAGDLSTNFITQHWTGNPAPAAGALPTAVLLGAAALALAAPTPTTATPANPWQQPGGGPPGERLLRFQHADQEYGVPLQRSGASDWSCTIDDQPTSFTSSTFPDSRIVIRQGATTLRLHGVRTTTGYLLMWQGHTYTLTSPTPPTVETTTQTGAATSNGSLTAPMPGTIIALHVAPGETVQAHQPLLVLEAMKMEQTIAAPHAGTVAQLPHQVGATVAAGTLLAEITPA